MRYTLTRHRLAICSILAVAVIGNTGCRSGVSFPGSSLFSWSKKPSEETLAGKGPTNITPTSPATKESPSLYAGTTTKPANPYGTAGLTNSSPNPSLTTNPTASTVSYGHAATNPTSPYTKPAPTTGAPGAAAMANGYTTGAYNTFAQTANQTATQAAGAANAYAQAGSAYAQNVANQAASNVSNTVNNAASQYALPSSNAYPGLAGVKPVSPTAATEPAVPQIPSVQTYSGQTANSLYSMPNTANVAQTPAAGSGSYASAPVPGNAPAMNMPSTPGYTPVGSDQNRLASGMTAPTNASTAGYAMPSTQTTATTASYRPGSTQRTTGYDFSSKDTSPTTGLPANTASGSANPGYSVPTTPSYR